MLSEIKAQDITPQAEAITTAPVEAEKPDAVTPTPESEEPKKQTMVPHGAFHEERERRKAAEARAVQLEQLEAQRLQEWQIGQQRLAQIAQRLEQRDAPPMPDREQDPIAYQTVVAEQTARQVAQMRHEQQQREQAAWNQQQQWAQQNQQAQVMQRFTGSVQTAEAQFAQQHPDYLEAVKFAGQSRTKELIAGGFPPEEAAQITARDAQQLAWRWVNSGQNPAEMIYNIAKERGYQPQVVDDEQKASMREEGMKASKPTGGGTSKGKLTATQLASMSPSQLARLSDEDFRAVMG